MKLPSIQIGIHKAAEAIIQQGMAFFISLAPLAAAVANRGGIGTIAASGMSAEELRREIKRAKELLILGCTGLLAVNIMGAVTNFYELLQVCIDEGIPIVFTGAGIPEAKMFELTKDTNTVVVPIVSSGGVVRVMAKKLKLPKPAAIVGEGDEAGGHIGKIGMNTRKLLDDLKKALEEVGWEDVPIIMAGTVQTAEDFAEMLGNGAAGCGVGTRFALTTEAREYLAPWQDVMLTTKPGDIIIIGDKDPVTHKKRPGSPTGYPSRPRKNPLVDQLLANGFVPITDPNWKCLKNTCLSHCIFRESGHKESFCINDALRKAFKGDFEHGLFFTGARLCEITSIISVPDYFEEIEDGLEKIAA